MSPSPRNRLEDKNTTIELPSSSDECEAKSSAAPDSADNLTSAEKTALRAEKLAAIRAAIDAGHYDSDELLDQAMNRMREAMEDDSELQ